MLKKLSFIFLLFLLPMISWADTPVMLVIDAPNKPSLPNNLRTTLGSLPAGSKASTQGLSTLNEIGSAQFSADQLANVVKQIKAPIIIVDLRQESHGFLNDGTAVSWYASRDWGNLGKTPVEVEANQHKHLAALVGDKKLQINKITDKDNEGNIKNVNPMMFSVDNVYTEADLAKRDKLGYFRVYVTDGWRPDNQQVERFVQFVRTVPADTWLYFHCRAGKGRTTTFMAMYDMMRNAKKVSFDDIIQRQNLLGGHNLAKMPNKNSYKYSLAEKRIEFLRQFYNYAATNQDNFKTTWLEWLKKQKESS